MRINFLLIGFMCAIAPLTPAAVLLNLSPAGGAISGAAGQTAGWGFTLSNDANYAVVDSASLVGGSSLGTFADFISLPANFTVIGPAGPFAQSSWTQAFNTGAQTGLGSFRISAAALAGDTAAVTVDVFYDLFSRSPFDPAFNPDTDALSTGNLVTAAVSISVNGPATPPMDAPEPATWSLLGVGLVAAGILRRDGQGGARDVGAGSAGGVI
jgi:hypothetical protein